MRQSRNSLIFLSLSVNCDTLNCRGVFMIKRVMDSLAVGFGLSAGAKLGKTVAEDFIKDVFREPTPEEIAKEEADAKKKAAEDAKKAAEDEKKRAKALRDFERNRERQEAEIDDELAAMKRKLGK